MTVRLDDFDSMIVQIWRITPADLERVRQYVAKLQGHLPRTTWDDIEIGGVYGASALLHEVVELRILLSRDSHLLRRPPAIVQAFLPRNREAHLRGLTEEYLYLQRQVHRHFGVWCDIGALVRANALGDWRDIFDTDLPFTEPTARDVAQARIWLQRLKEMKR